MRAFSSHAVNGYVGQLKLIYRRTTTLKFFEFRSLVLPCSSFLENEFSISEDSGEDNLPNLKWVSNEIGDHKGHQVSGKETGDYVNRESSIVNVQKSGDGIKRRITSILLNRGWDKALWNELMIDLNQSNVTQILNVLFEESSDASLTFYFYRWSEWFNRSKHGIRAKCTMIHISVFGNMHQLAICFVKYLVKNNVGEGRHNLLFDVLWESRKDRRVLESVYSMLVSSYGDEKMVDVALELIYRMKLLGFFPSSWVCNSLLGALLDFNQLELAWEVYGEMQIRGMGFNPVTINLFIIRYCAEGSLSCACKLLFDMKNYGCKMDVVAYTTVIDALCKRVFLKDGTSLFYKMIQTGFSPNSVLISAIIDWYCTIGSLAQAIEILKMTSHAPDVFVYNSFMSKLCRYGNMVEAMELFDDMSQSGLFADCCSYTTIIGGFCKLGDIDQVLKYFGQMLKKGLKPDVITYTVLIDAYCKSKANNLQEVEHLYSMMIREGLNPDVTIFNILIDGHYRKGHIHAFEKLDMMRIANVSPDITTYNILIHGLV